MTIAVWLWRDRQDNLERPVVHKSTFDNSKLVSLTTTGEAAIFRLMSTDLDSSIQTGIPDDWVQVTVTV